MRQHQVRRGLRERARRGRGDNEQNERRLGHDVGIGMKRDRPRASNERDPITNQQVRSSMLTVHRSTLAKSSFTAGGLDPQPMKQRRYRREVENLVSSHV